ncbi:UDP-glycosyltransferase 72B1-like [Phoenix dactylifera]|uniref:Glycosyltransferase n=1 Tax=Phoenix dactylifera TaxID=42345 RepID=A0A8B9AP27_PHODC|nr:UDP-glycosyltransferase 72B1-like [Phoenix dactylifera]
MEEPRPPRIALLSSPGLGHIIPFAELARHLVLRQRIAVTLITHPAEPSAAVDRALFNNLPDEVDTVCLPEFPPEDSSNGTTKLETRVFETIKANFPHLRSLLSSISSSAPLAALVIDTFCIDALDVASELGIPAYLYFTCSCTALSLSFHILTLDASFQGEYRDLPEPVRLPGSGCVPVRGEDLFEPIQDRRNEVYKWFVRVTKRFYEAKGILVNSFEDLEPEAVKGLKEADGIPPVYPVGPLVRTAPDEEHECLRWLDRQPRGSVVYVCFGSGGTLTCAQTRELALGLERSGQRFLWVVKSPHEREVNGTYLGDKGNKNPLDFLPEGFPERTEGVGFLVPSWAPQVAVLGHASTGGFISHCGWNSTLESIMKGVPIISWPLFAEQRINAAMLAEDVEVALRPKASESGLVERDEIASVVKRLMEGEEGKRLRKRAEELSHAAARSLGQEGSSVRATSEVAREWMDRRA